MSQLADFAADDPSVFTEMQAKASQWVVDLLKMDTNSPDFSAKVEILSSIGEREVAALSDRASLFLDRPASCWAREGAVATNLARLRQIVASLDPRRTVNLLVQKRLFGVIPAKPNISRYFDQYTSKQDAIQTALSSLARGRDDLLRENVAIETERQQLHAMMERLQRSIGVCQALDTELEHKVGELEYVEPIRARSLRECALFPVRQRAEDLSIQMAVSLQGFLVLGLNRENNTLLIGAVDHATTTVIAALRTAVIVAEALTHHKLVLDKISALRSAASNMIANATEQGSLDGADSQHQELGEKANIEMLQRAFGDIFRSMDALEDFRTTSSDSLKASLDALATERTA